MTEMGLKRNVYLQKDKKQGKRFAMELNELDFEYGDVVKVFHAEPDRLKWYQNNTLVDQGKAKNKKRNYSKSLSKGSN